MKMVFSLFLGLLTLLYPVVIYFGLEHIQARFMVLLLACLFVLRSLININQNNRKTHIALIATIGLFAVIISVSNSTEGLLLYPVLVNIVFLFMFAGSLYFPPPVIERLARLKDPHFPNEAVPYTRNLTKIWCCFFILNGCVAAYTALFCSLTTWSMYNGLIAYILIATLFLGELLIRPLMKKKIRQCQ